MKKILCGMALGVMGTFVVCKMMKGNCNCDDMVDDLMRKKNKALKKMKKIFEN